MSGERRRVDPQSFRVPLLDDLSEAVRFQAYGPSPEIDGVTSTSLRKSRGEDGWFAELFRVDKEGRVEALGDERALPLRQVSISRAEPHRVNAFHIHPRRGQNEYWTTVEGQLLVWLVDCRRDSPTAGVRRSFVLSGESPARLLIPAGVAHGYRAGIRGALLVYGMDRQFDVADPDEGRLSWDFFGADLWERDTG